MSAPLRLGIAGLGTVGIGVVKIIQSHADLLAARHPELGRVLTRCSFLLDEVAVRDVGAPASGAMLDVLPPFAGG